MLVDFTSRTVRDDKQSVSLELESIFDRLGSSLDRWTARIRKLKERGFIGSFLASSVERLREVANRIGRKWLVNVG